MVLPKFYFGVVTVSYAAWAVYKIPQLPDGERTFTAGAATIFFLLYLLPETIFGARIDSQELGIDVRQYRRDFIPYTEIRQCYSIFLFPFQMVIVITKRRFPLTVLISGDSLKGKRRSLIQDGELARIVKGKIRSSLAEAHPST